MWVRGSIVTTSIHRPRCRRPGASIHSLQTGVVKNVVQQNDRTKTGRFHLLSEAGVYECKDTHSCQAHKSTPYFHKGRGLAWCFLQPSQKGAIGGGYMHDTTRLGPLRSLSRHVTDITWCRTRPPQRRIVIAGQGPGETQN